MKVAGILIFAVAVCLALACGSNVPSPDRRADLSPSPSVAAMNANDQSDKEGKFAANLPAGFQMPSDDAGRRLLKEYGALFVARGVAVPNVVVFKDAASVREFQASAGSATEKIGDAVVELQESAMRALMEAIGDGAKSGLKITPRGEDAAKRSYEDTVSLWTSRVEPGLEHWLSAARISAAEAQRIRSLPPYEQVPEIFKLEQQGIFFSKDLSKSIIYSVAPPGASQHLSMLALDVSEYDDANVRALLARHGWFQTVVSDMPHFTF